MELLIGNLIILAAILIVALSKRLNLNKYTFTKIFFFLFLISSISIYFSYLTSNSFLLIGYFIVYWAFALVLLHSSTVIGKKKTILLFIILLLFGLVSEILSIKYSWIFGNYYYPGLNFFFGLVPYQIPISWAVIIYTSYTLTNIMLKGFRSKKPYIKEGIFTSIILIIILSSIDGLIAMNLDMMMDPISVAGRNWIWIGGGQYFGVPITNFMGWFFVTFIATFTFRFYESFQKTEDKYLFKLSYVPIYLYLFYFLNNGIQAIIFGLYPIILIGIATMMPFILITTLIIILSKRNINLRTQQ